MARRAGAGVVEAAGGQSTEEQIPVSTLAAKIVDSRADAQVRQQPEGKELFARLLQEFLNDPSIEEAHLETNAKLVLVVAEAGLDAALRDDPFSQNDRIDQARDSLAVIKLTIKRVPAVVFYADSSNASGASPPVFLVLFPRIIALLGCLHLEAVHQDAVGLLTTCLVASLSNFDTWTVSQVVQEAVTSTLEELLEAIERHQSHSSRVTTSVSIDLPSQRVISTIWPDLHDVIVVSRATQTHVGDSVQASHIASHLASSLSAASSMGRGQRASYDQGLWLLESLWRIAVCLLNIARGSKSTAPIKMALAQICSSTSAILSRLDQASAIDRANRAVAGILRCVLNHELLSRDTGLQLAVSKLLSVGGSALLPTVNSKEGDIHAIIKELALDNDSLTSLHEDLQNALRSAAGLAPSKHTDETLATAQGGFKSMAQGTLEQTSVALGAETNPNSIQDSSRPSKRRRVDHDAPPAASDFTYRALIQQVTSQLGLAPRLSLIGIDEDVIKRFKAIALPDQEAILATLAELPCRSWGAHDVESQVSSRQQTCELCNHPWDARCERTLSKEAEAFEKLLSRLLDWSGVHRLKRSRLLIMLAVQRYINHTADPDSLDISKSPLGQWCLKSLHSSLRELRIAAGRSVASFVRSDIPGSIRRSNGTYCLNFLKALGERNHPSEKETLVLTWAQVARVCASDELNTALLQLVESLGASHPLICSVAYEEIQGCAEFRQLTVEALFRPYWRTVAVAVVKDLRTKPQKLQSLCDLLGVSNVQRFLLQTQAETIPYLVANREHEILLRIASARNATIPDICFRPSKHLSLILAYLLLQHTSDPEKTISDLLGGVAPEFKSMELAQLVRLEPVPIACEMFKAAGEAPAEKKPLIHQAIKTFVAIAERKTGHSKPVSRSTKLLAQFLDQHILGILTRLSDVVDAPGETYATTEKRRCLHAIAEMLSMAQANFNFAIAAPQIKACMQSAIKEPGLCDDAMMLWSIFSSSLGTDELDDLLEYTFAIIASTWNRLSADTQSVANNLIAQFIKDHNVLVRENILFLPSLRSIPLFSKYEAEIQKFKNLEPLPKRLEAFIVRCSSQTALICEQGASELLHYLMANQRTMQELASAPEPHPVVVGLVRALVESAGRFANEHPLIGSLNAQCLGIIGCIDTQESLSAEDHQHIVVLSNFDRVSETVDFIVYFLEHVLIKAFHSAANSRVQNYLAWAMQELLKHCEFQAPLSRSRSSQAGAHSQRWMALSEAARNTLLPFFDTKYMLNRPTENLVDRDRRALIFTPSKPHPEWLREIVADLLQRGHGENAKIFFPVLSKIIRGHDLSIPKFLFPYAATSVMLAGTDVEKETMRQELLLILETNVDTLDATDADNVRKASENVFEVLDYMARWLQRKRKQLNDARGTNVRGTSNSNDFDEVKEITQISSIEQVFQSIPARIIASRATECRSFSRALYHWEQYLREGRDLGNIQENSDEEQEILDELQRIYAQIDEPDGIEGISAHLQLMEAEPEATVLQYRMHGRWSAALSWYELEIERQPANEALQVDLLSCFKESGQLSSLVQFVNSRRTSQKQLVPNAYAYAAEASWSLGRFQDLQSLVEEAPEPVHSDFRIVLGSILLALRDKNLTEVARKISLLRNSVIRDLSSGSATFNKANRTHILNLHALFEVERIAGASDAGGESREAILETLDSRLGILGAMNSDKQYLLGVRRAAMCLSPLTFTERQLSSVWLTTARLSRKEGLINVAFDAINHASQLDANSALIEYSRLLWKDGSHKKAVQTLKGAIDADAFHHYNILQGNTGLTMFTEDQQQKVSNALLAKAQLLAAKWLDQSGQAGSSELIREYQTAVRSNAHWEKGHYYLGRFYNKIFESEKVLPANKQSRSFITGETAKLVIDNFVRSIGFGSKYHYQSVPKIITLWLDFGQEVYNDIGAPKPKHDRETDIKRKEYLEMMHSQILKYVDRLQPYLFYTAMPQMISRIGHPHKNVWETLAHIIVRTAIHFPRQSLWSVLAVARSTAKDKAARGSHVLNRMRQGLPKKEKAAINGDTLKALISQGQKLTENLLLACEHQVDQRVTHVELTRDLNFHHKRLTPCGLVVPIERTLMATLPTMPGAAAIRAHKAFPYGDVLIEGFIEDVLVLSSLQRPRKLTVRGSDGQLYGLLCKPKDDLRKDQRLMEFNAMIERSLKRDVDASKRQLYIRTYGVVPLNEECGTIEWVDGLKPMRDIIISSYKAKGVRIDYNEIRNMLTEACATLPRSASIFTDKVLKIFKPVLFEWFIDMFPEPETWYAARLRYARSCAVMSIVGHVLGLGDRHGENVLLESGSGGVFHVDFNCLFDKGLTFEKPEKVPFRLTHNMVHAFGAYGVEGPFRKSAEVTLKVLRQHEDALMTIMETFLYDPTADFMGSHKKKKSVPGVPETPLEVLELVRNKLRGFKHGEKVPLSIEGYVDDLINQARSPQNLAEMYIGWCAFF